MTWNDPIVAETRKHREDYSQQFDFDLWAMFKDLKKKEGEHSDRIVSLKPKDIHADSSSSHSME